VTLLGKHAKFRLTGNEILLAVIVGFMGFFLTVQPFLLFMNAMNPLVGFAIYEGMLFLILYLLGRGGLVIFKIKIENLSQTIGLYLITFATFITIDWTSGYIQYVATGSFAGVNNIYVQSEDGVTWYLWRLLLPMASAIQVVHMLTYVVTPVCLCLLGAYLVKGKKRGKTRFSIQDILLAIVIGLMGFFLTTTPFILFLSVSSLLIGFAIYETVRFLILYFLSRDGLVIFNVQIKSLAQTIGIYLITFAMFITFDWTSGYIQYATTGSFNGATHVFMMAEDGVTWYLWTLLITPNSTMAIQTLRILTYVVTPICLCLLGGYLAKGRVKI
jgi:hypothetical protein